MTDDEAWDGAVIEVAISWPSTTPEYHRHARIIRYIDAHELRSPGDPVEREARRAVDDILDAYRGAPR